MLQRYANAIGFPAIAPHDACSTCAKLCRAARGELEHIQLLLGRASVQTERYLGTKQDLVHAPNDAIKLRIISYYSEIRYGFYFARAAKTDPARTACPANVG